MNKMHYLDLVDLTDHQNITSLVENKRIYPFEHFELNIFETFDNVSNIRLSYEGLIVSSMIRGKKILYCDDDSGFEFLPGSSVIVPSGISLFADFPEASKFNPVQCATIALNWELVEQNLHFLNKHYNRGKKWKLDFTNYHFNNNKMLASSLNRLISISTEPQTEEREVLADLTLKTLLIRVMQTQEINRQNPAPETPKEMMILKNYIKNNITNELSIKELSDFVGKSRSSLFRLFRDHLDISPIDFIKKERVQHAKQLLEQTDISVSEACYQSGFNTMSYFGKVFKKEMGCSPSDYAFKNKILHS